MTADKTQGEGNEIIAVFDGWVQDINVNDKPYWHPERNMTMYTYPDAFKYHSSWDWLQCAWAKCYKELAEINSSTGWNLIDKMSDALVWSDIVVAWGLLCKSIKYINEHRS